MKYDTILCLIRFNVYFINNILHLIVNNMYIYFIEILASIKFSIITLLNKIIGQIRGANVCAIH